MNVITRQLTKEILLAASFAMVSLLALFSFFDVVGQSSRIGTRYDIGVALQFALMNLPRRFYQVMPIVALLSGIYTLSRWASESQFVVLRVSGLSALRLAKMLLVPAAVMMVFTYAVGEWVAPYTDRVYTDMKSVNIYNSSFKRIRGYDSGVWVKDIVKDSVGKPRLVRFVNVESLLVGEDMKTGGWRVFEFSEPDGALKRIIHAKSGVYVPGRGWHLIDARVESLPKIDRSEALMLEKASIRQNGDMMLESDMKPEILEVLTVKPTAMGISELRDYIAHLKDMHQTSERYEVEFWNHLFYPLVVLVMLAMAMPFAYLNTRSGGMSVKVFIGLVIGILFYGFDNAFSFAGAAGFLPAPAVPLVPIIIMAIATSMTLWHVERR